MKVNGKPQRTIWLAADGESVGIIDQTRLPPEGSRAANPAFDVTPSRLVTGLITERGVTPATAAGLRQLFPERSPAP